MLLMLLRSFYPFMSIPLFEKFTSQILDPYTLANFPNREYSFSCSMNTCECLPWRVERLPSQRELWEMKRKSILICFITVITAEFYVAAFFRKYIKLTFEKSSDTIIFKGGIWMPCLSSRSLPKSGFPSRNIKKPLHPVELLCFIAGSSAPLRTWC